jgi:hypothetical protein
MVPSFKPNAMNFFMRLLAMTASILKLATIYLVRACLDEPPRSFNFLSASVTIEAFRTGPVGAALGAFGLAILALAILDGAGVEVARTVGAGAATGDPGTVIFDELL